MATAFIAVGTNLGNRLLNIKKAEELLKQNSKIKIVNQSAIYETRPCGGPPQGLFLNAVWKIETSLVPQELLKELQAIELKMGRVREIVNGPRTLDLDLLDFDGQVEDSQKLALPHPRLHEREFVLRPLYDVAPGWVHPKLGKSVAELWSTLSFPLSRE